ncbi:hypothetical protein GIV23_12035 [Pseudomonas sp. PA-1-2A]|uniref:hypothetical protein n=2 Tax=Pseudomonas TaxID=286 RepID=UPI001EF0CBFE|nr:MULTISPECIES: hypothetical protein [Pseudomonas]MCF5691104.1 hypothetical protein [Pseudomonas sp. PA-1-8C]MCF5788698.1 hypothetical protein [Pseudomonas sp. PA-1-6G]MCF5791504.1 hypothetical protein [Pseudomonas sp. PA-1-6B]MCF5800477.1 hypothetical protein [Pseudomonas sp. PA-1-5A]MCF5814038.1 hypothetical protein [Pseudomonas sp. PA-1-2A]
MSQIKERPILFSAPMVRAILEGRKTVTRRAVKPQPEVRMVDMIGPMLTFKNKRGGHWLYPNAKAQIIADCPYGKPGDRLWVRETFIDLHGTGVEHRPDPAGPLQRYAYAADCRPRSHSDEARKDFGLKYKPSIHMPRAACRILLEITDVRVERLQDITEEQARAEGVRLYTDHAELGDWWHVDGIETYSADPRKSFELLWSSVGGDWNANPWVWVVECKRV